MASASTKTAAKKSILKPSITLKGHKGGIGSISYFPDGQRLISGSGDKTTRQWDLKTGREFEEARSEGSVLAVAVSSNGQWVATGTAGGELKVCEVETGIVKTFEGHSHQITCIDISGDNTQLASGSWDETARIWNLNTGKIMAGPFKSETYVGAVRFSPESKKLAVMSYWGKRLEVWDIQSQKLDVSVGDSGRIGVTRSPVFWTKNKKNIIAAFRFSQDDEITTFYEFDASTLKTVRTPFKGHTNLVTGLALSFDEGLLASASYDNTIKLWAFESRQLLRSFDVQNLYRLVLSPNSRQIAYTVHTVDDYKICICDIPPDTLAQARDIARKKANIDHPLHSRAIRPPVGYRRPPIPIAPRPPPTRDPQQPAFPRLSKFLRFSHANAVPVRHIQPRDPLDLPATSPLPSNRIRGECAPSTSLPGSSTFFNSTRSSSVKGKQKVGEPKRKPSKFASVPLGQATYADAVGVDDGYRPYVVFFCLSWFQKKEKKPKPQPVYDDEFEDDDDEEEEENVPAVPPRAQHEVIELKPMASRSQPEAGPSRLAATNHAETQSLRKRNSLNM